MTDITKAARSIVEKYSQAVVLGRESMSSGQAEIWTCIAQNTIGLAAGKDDDELQSLADALFWRIQHFAGVPLGFRTRETIDELASALRAAAEALHLEPLPPQADDDADDEVDLDRPPVEFVYENWEGEIRVRKAVPLRLIYGSNKWHTEDQWMLEAMDVESGEPRTFAFKGIIKFLK
jgi:hypothetical protein